MLELATTTLGISLENDVTAARTALEISAPSADGRRWVPAALGYYERGRYLRTGVLLLCCRESAPGPLSLELVEATARLLVERPA